MSARRASSYWLWFISIVLLIVPGLNLTAFFVWLWALYRWVTS